MVSGADGGRPRPRAHAAPNPPDFQRGCVAVDKNDVPPAEEPQQRRRRIHRQARSSDDKQFCLLQLAHRRANRRIIKPFLVQHNVRLDDSAAGAFRHAFTVPDVLRRKKARTLQAIIPVDAAVQFQHRFAACLLVQAVDILRDDRRQTSAGFQLRQKAVRVVRLRVQGEHFRAVEAIKFLRMARKKGVGQNFLWRIGELLMIQSVLRAEIGNAALRRNTRAAEKHDAAALINPLLQFFVHRWFFLPFYAVSAINCTNHAEGFASAEATRGL